MKVSRAMSNTSDVEVRIKITPSIRPNLTAVLASAIVTIETPSGPLTIHDCRIVQSKSGAVWFSFPTFAVPLGGRQFRYDAVIELPAPLAQRISAEAIREFETWQNREDR